MGMKEFINYENPKDLHLNHPTIKRIFAIAQEINEKNLSLDVDSLYRTAKRELKIPRKSLLRIVNYLFNNKMLIRKPNITTKTVLINPNRKRVYDFIRQNIGASFSFIKKNSVLGIENSEISNGQIVWHLKMLLHFEFIKKIKIDNSSIFIPKEIKDDVGILHFFLRDALNRKIILFIIKNNNNSLLPEIFNILELDNFKVIDRANLLIDNEILLFDKESTMLSLNPKKKDKLLEVLKEYQDERFKEVLYK